MGHFSQNKKRKTWRTGVPSSPDKQFLLGTKIQLFIIPGKKFPIDEITAQQFEKNHAIDCPEWYLYALCHVLNSIIINFYFKCCFIHQKTYTLRFLPFNKVQFVSYQCVLLVKCTE